MSGDARRALDICRRAIELSQLAKAKTTDMSHINAALKEMFTSSKLIALGALSHYEKLFVRAIVAECSARSPEDVVLERVIMQVFALCTLEGGR